MSPSNYLPNRRRLALFIPLFLTAVYSSIWMVIYIRNDSQTVGGLLRNLPKINAVTPDLSRNRPNASNFVWSADEFECLGWRSTSNCDPYGPREYHKDLSCNHTVSHSASGYCEIRNRTSGKTEWVALSSCGGAKEDFKCGDIAYDFVNFKLLADLYVKHPQPLPLSSPKVSTKGIVIAAYRKVLINAFVNILLLRHHGCTLPVELWFKSGELSRSDPLITELTSKYNVTLRVIREDTISKWLVKIYSIFYSSFDDVLLLDADNVPAIDPTYLFYTEEYLQTGAMFWPDYWRPGATIFDLDEKSMIWDLLGVDYVRMFEQESGQVLVNRRKCQAELNLLLFYCYHFNIIRKLNLVWGDKDLFRLAWLKLGKPFHMIKQPPGSAGLHMDKYFCGMTMVQHDPKGNPVFFHRNTIKFSSDSSNRVWWTHIQQYIGDRDPMEFSIENTLVANHAFGPYDCFGAYKYGDIRATDGTAKFSVTEISKTPFANLELIALQFAKEGRRLEGQIL